MSNDITIKLTLSDQLLAKLAYMIQPPKQDPMAAMAQLPLADHPGKKFVYHLGFSILGAVLEAAAGQDMGQFFKEQIFEPLGMVDSYFYVPDDALDRFPPCYVPKKINGNTEFKLISYY